MKKNILIVDSVSDHASSCEHWLSDVGYYIKKVPCGYDAFEAIQLHDFDLILLSEFLPRMSGLSFVKKLKHSHKARSIPVVLLSEAPDIATLCRFRDLGVCDCLVKPVTQNALLLKLECLLGTIKKPIEIPILKSDKTGYSEVVFRSRVVSIGEMGMVIASTIPLEENSVHRLRAKVFGDMGLRSPNLTVTNCAGSDEGYQVSLSYVSMSQEDQDSIRSWVSEHSYTDVTQ